MSMTYSHSYRSEKNRKNHLTHTTLARILACMEHATQSTHTAETDTAEALRAANAEIERLRAELGQAREQLFRERYVVVWRIVKELGIHDSGCPDTQITRAFRRLQDEAQRLRERLRGALPGGDDHGR